MPDACSVPDAKERMSLFAGGIKEDKGVKDLYRGGANCRTAMYNNVKIYYCSNPESIIVFGATMRRTQVKLPKFFIII